MNVGAVESLAVEAAALAIPALITLMLISRRGDLAPVLQFAVGVGIKHEPMPIARLIGFSLVWLALIVLTVDGVRTQRNSAVERAAESVAA